MGYSQEHIEQTRARILLEAGRLMRRHGHSGVSIPQIMGAANLTHGGFYAHFKSKDKLFEAMVGEDFDFTNQLNKLQDMTALEGKNRAEIAASYYLDPSKSNKVAPACTLASSSQDVARSNVATKKAFTRGFKRLVRAFSVATGKKQTKKREERSMAALATCVGGLIISRALEDRELAAELLNACLDNVRSLSA